MPCPRLGLGAARVVERQRGAEDRRGDRLAVHRDLRLVQVQAALAVHEERQLAGRDAVLPIPLAVHVLQLVVHRGEPIVAGAHRVDQAMPRRVLVVVEIALGALPFRPRVERVDEHAGDRARARDLDAGRGQVLRHRRHLPVGRGGRARGQRLGQPALPERAHEPLVALGAQRVRARGELVAQADEVVAELGGEEGGGALHRGDLHPVGRGARGGWIRRHWRGSVRCQDPDSARVRGRARGRGPAGGRGSRSRRRRP